VLPDDEERKLLGALIVISTGAEDLSQLNVPVEVGRRFLLRQTRFGSAHSRLNSPDFQMTIALSSRG
jgi:hypothetical protein